MSGLREELNSLIARWRAAAEEAEVTGREMASAEPSYTGRALALRKCAVELQEALRRAES